MNYHLKSKRKTTQKIILAILAVFFLVLFLGGNQVKNSFQILNVPINNVISFIKSPFVGFWGYFQAKNYLISKNFELDKENKILKMELLTTEVLRKENEQLKQNLEYKELNPEKNLVKILNKPPVSPFDTIVVNLGGAEIAPNQKVLYKNIVIGYVEQVFSQTALVRLYSSPEQKINVSLGENDFEAKGQGSGKFKIDLPKDYEIATYDKVYFGEDLIGQINGIEINETSNFKEVYFSYPFSFSDIDWVFVSK